MSVLIDGIPMPKDCRDCCFKYESDATDRLVYCYISGCWIIPKDSERAEVCLLKEAQPEPHYDKWCATCKEYDQEKHCCPRWNRVIRQTVTDMKDAKQRWIPIEKELPPVNKTVLLSHRSGVTIGWYNGMSYRTNTSARYIRTVKAWMPLPEQYRGEGD